MESKCPRRDPLSPFRGVIERAGNALPHPAMLFLLFALVVIAASSPTRSPS